MKVLVDECVDWRIVRDLHPHEAKTLKQLGWEKIKNGSLLALAAAKRPARRVKVARPFRPPYRWLPASDGAGRMPALRRAGCPRYNSAGATVLERRHPVGRSAD